MPASAAHGFSVLPWGGHSCPPCTGRKALRHIFAGRFPERTRALVLQAWGLERAAFAPGTREALEGNRLPVLEIRNREGNLAAAEQRNRFVIEHADPLWLPHVAPGGMLDRLIKEKTVNQIT